MKGDLKKAEGLFKRRKYEKVIRLLEPQIFRFRQSFDFFYLAGISCLKTGDLGGASTYLQRGLGLKPRDTKSQLGLAIVHLERQEVQEALRCFLEILDNEPGNRPAQKGLAILQKNSSPERIIDLTDSGKIQKLLPGRGRRFASMLIAALGVTVLLSAVLYVLFFTDLVIRKVEPRDTSVTELQLDDIGELTDLRGEYRYILTDREVEKSFADAKSYFADFRDNMAQREINRILGSNASQKVKEQARTIAAYLTEPNFTSLKDPFPFTAVNADPYLHDRAYVLWRGKLSNLAVAEDVIEFDLLVGYENNEVLLGIVPVRLPFGALLNQGDSLEILGRVRLDAQEELYIEGVSVHKLVAE